MTDIIERYIHQVGSYVPRSERAEIEAELRSQISDQLDDRFGGAAMEEEIRTVLVELGDPRRMAASYAGEQYLIGPILYPFMMNVLRKGWAVVPVIVVIVHAVLAVVSSEPITLGSVVLNTISGLIQAMLLFSGIVVLIFAIIERSGEDLNELTGQDKAFDPADLPAIDVSGGFDRYEAAFGVAFSVFMIIIMLYFWRVGGLTLRFNLSDPGEVIPVPIPWLVMLILNTTGLMTLTLLAIRRGFWTIGTLALETILEVIGAVFLYFAVINPLFEYGIQRLPGLAIIPFIERFPEAFLGVAVVIALVGGVTKMVKA